MVSAGKPCREKMLASITEWQSEYGYALQPNDLLFLVCDHWISRSKTSRELLHWWMGELPDPINEYTEQGITLYTSESQLTQSLNSRFDINPCYIKFTTHYADQTNSNLFENISSCTPYCSGSLKMGMRTLSIYLYICLIQLDKSY